MDLNVIKEAWGEICLMAFGDDPHLNNIYTPKSVVIDGKRQALVGNETPYKFEAYFNSDGSVSWLEMPF